MSRPAGEASRRRRLIVALALVAALVILVIAVRARDDDPFVGRYWEPSTARRVEVRKDGDQYWFYYGSAQRKYGATLAGHELRIGQPLGDPIVVRCVGKGRLDLIIDGTTTRLEPLSSGE